jgi:hypothetical protein
MATVSSRPSQYYWKLSDIILFSDILLPTQKQCYVGLSTLNKFVEIQRATTLVTIQKPSFDIYKKRLM